MLNDKDYIRCESSYGNGMLWVFVQDERDGKAIGGICTTPDSRYHKEYDYPLTEEGVEELDHWLVEEGAKLIEPNRAMMPPGSQGDPTPGPQLLPRCRAHRGVRRRPARVDNSSRTAEASVVCGRNLIFLFSERRVAVSVAPRRHGGDVWFGQHDSAEKLLAALLCLLLALNFIHELY